MTESDMKKVVRQVQAMYHKHRGTLAESALELPNLDPADENWREQILSILQAMPPDAFERLAQRILLESGFVDVHVRGGTGDGGIDGLGVLRVNLLSFRVFYQCKRYKASVGSGEIRDFRGAMVGRTDKGLFMAAYHYGLHAAGCQS